MKNFQSTEWELMASGCLTNLLEPYQLDTGTNIIGNSLERHDYLVGLHYRNLSFLLALLLCKTRMTTSLSSEAF